MGGPIPAGPSATVWTDENRFASEQTCKGAGKNANECTGTKLTKLVPLHGLQPNKRTMCGEYVCVSEENAHGNTLSCSPFSKNDRPGEACFAQKFAYATLDRFIRLITDKLICDIGVGTAKDGCGPALNLKQVHEALKNRKMPLPVLVNSADLVNAYYSPGDVELVFGDGQGKFLLATDGDIIVHEAAHWLIDTINPTLGSFPTGLGNAIHEGSADAIAALHFGDPQMAEDFNFYKNNRGSKLGLRTVKNTRTIANIKTMEEHEAGKIISGFWWSLYERLLSQLQNANKDAARDNPALLGQMARNATLKLILAHAGSYAIPSPDAPDFLEAVSRGATDLNFIDGLPELKKNNVTLNTVLNEITAEGKARGLNTPIWPMRQRQRPRPCTGSRLTFGTAIRITGAGGDGVFFQPQLYATKNGPAVVVGHGAIVRNGIAEDKGLRAIEPGAIDEAVDVSRGEAFNTALSAIGKELAELLAARTDEAAIPASSRKKLLTIARKKLEAKHASGAQLAILPDGKELVWLFDAGIANIAVDAKSGKVNILFRGIID